MIVYHGSPYLVSVPMFGEGNPHNDYELHDSIEKMLTTLPDTQRMLLLMHDLEGYSYKEMAEITGLSEQQVATYLYRARVKARKYLTENR